MLPVELVALDDRYYPVFLVVEPGDDRSLLDAVAGEVDGALWNRQKRSESIAVDNGNNSGNNIHGSRVGRQAGRQAGVNKRTIHEP